MSKIAELLNKEICNISMYDLNNLWEEIVDELTQSWYNELSREIEDSMADLGFEPDINHNSLGYESGIKFQQKDIVCTIYISRPILGYTLMEEDSEFRLSAIIERSTSSTTTHSYDIEADTIQELLIEIQVNSDLLSEV
jgi:hypothetical protein